MRFLTSIMAGALSLLPLQSLAVVYKCVDDEGAVTYMNAHCGKGAKIVDTEINVLESGLRKKESYASDVPPPPPANSIEGERIRKEREE